MNPIFVDTFFWIALTNPNDEAHIQVKSLKDKLDQTTLLTTDEVLIEYLNWFSKMGTEAREKSAIFVRGILKNPHVQVVEQSRTTFIMGLDLYESRLDKGYSATDCISMQLMKQEGISEVLTGDKHFRQENFKILIE